MLTKYVHTHTRDKTNNYVNDIRKKVFNVRKKMLVLKVFAQSLYSFPIIFLEFHKSKLMIHAQYLGFSNHADRAAQGALAVNLNTSIITRRGPARSRPTDRHCGPPAAHLAIGQQ